jgi:hypothetical protein
MAKWKAPKGFRVFRTFPAMRSTIVLGWYMTVSPPVMEHITAKAQDQLAGIGLAGTRLGTQTAMEAPPQFHAVFQDAVPGPYLGVSDHPPWKMLMDERADGGTGAAVEAVQGGRHPEPLQFLRKGKVHESHVESPSQGALRRNRQGTPINSKAAVSGVHSARR